MSHDATQPPAHDHQHDHRHGTGYATPVPPPDPDTWDAVILGGGVAGLSAAIPLGRSRRRVLVLDAGDPRNAPSGHLHNYLGQEGTPPAELLRLGRAEAAQYGVRAESASVVGVRPWGREGAGFLVTTGDGTEVAARRVVVATGTRDELPDVAGLGARWGRDVLHCPYCHGWEVRGRRVVVLAWSPLAVHHALLFRQLTDAVTVALLDPAAAPGDADLERLDALGIPVVADRPVEVLVADDALTGLRLASGEVLACDAVVVATSLHARLDGLAGSGLVAEPVEGPGGLRLGTALAADPTGATAVPGVFAAGNVTAPMATIAAAGAAGVMAGARLNADLVEEDAAAAVRRSRAVWFEQPAWEDRYRDSDGVWSGRVNPQLAAEAADLRPGRVLDVGSGEGGDAIWLAQAGWEVTGLDFSAVALERAAARADAAGVADVRWRQGDVRVFEAGDERFELVSSQFMHQPAGGMLDVVRRLAGAVAPGGHLLVVGHHPADLATGLRHGGGHFLFTPEDLLPALEGDAWDVEVAEVRSRTVDGPDGDLVTVRDSVVRARRR